MASRYLLQIVDRQSGNVVQFEPGLQAEKDFVADCVKRVVELGVGLLKTEAHVEQDVRTGIELAILDLKAQVRTGS